MGDAAGDTADACDGVWLVRPAFSASPGPPLPRTASGDLDSEQGGLVRTLLRRTPPTERRPRPRPVPGGSRQLGAAALLGATLSLGILAALVWRRSLGHLAGPRLSLGFDRLITASSSRTAGAQGGFHVVDALRSATAPLRQQSDNSEAESAAQSEAQSAAQSEAQSAAQYEAQSQAQYQAQSQADRAKFAATFGAGMMPGPDNPKHEDLSKADRQKLAATFDAEMMPGPHVPPAKKHLSKAERMKLAATFDAGMMPGAHRQDEHAEARPEDTRPSRAETQAASTTAAAGGPEHAKAMNPGEFVTNVEQVRTFAWCPPIRTVEQAFDEAFPGGKGWEAVRFGEGGAAPLTREALIAWVKDELIAGPDPFVSSGGLVPVPWPDPEESQSDQLGAGHWVGYSRRQVCFIVAKSLLGARVDGYAHGLLRYLELSAWGKCQARTGDFGRAFLGLLAACAADPGLSNGAQGPLLLVAKASDMPPMEEVRNASAKAPLAGAGLRVCQYSDGAEGTDRIDRVPTEGCSPPSGRGPGRDFMTGGLAGQAVQDISAAWLGGYIYGNTCDKGGGQDERLMIYMPEVAALSFFLSQAPGDANSGDPPQLRQPVWILGARRLFRGLDGTGRFDSWMELDPDSPLTSDLVPVTLDGGGAKTYAMSASRPLVAFMSESQGFLGWPEGSGDVQRARRNRHPRQREVAPAVPYAFEKQVRAWYRAVALTSYSRAVRPVLRTLVRSLGAGPWLAGLWWGDSQVGFLAMWLGQAAAAQTWAAAGGEDGHATQPQAAGAGDAPLPLDYYIYSAFTENPGNQCFVHAAADCAACLEQCGDPPASSYFLPGYAMMGANFSACVTSSADCGARGLQDVVLTYRSVDARTLWLDVEDALRTATPDAGKSVFDLLLAHAAAS